MPPSSGGRSKSSAETGIVRVGSAIAGRQDPNAPSGSSFASATCQPKSATDIPADVVDGADSIARVLLLQAATTIHSGTISRISFEPATSNSTVDGSSLAPCPRKTAR